MRKIIICMLLFTTNVFAEKISNYSSAWKVGILYNTDVSGESVIGKYGSYTTVIIAREIYENGGKFCPTRVIGSSMSYENVTLRYQDNPLFTCYTICKPGHYGNNCEKIGTPSICENTNYESVFKDKLKIDVKSDVSLSSYNINAFSAGSETSGYGLSQVDIYQLTTLGIVGYVPYGIVVAPIKISTAGGGAISSISVNTNNQTTTLCASGYKLEKGTCVKPSNCKIIVPHKPNNDSTGGITYCTGYDDNYDSAKHYLVEESACYSYRCKEGGFDINSDRKDCIKDCGKTKKSGVLDNGNCKICGDNQMFKDGDCVDYKPLYAKDLIDGLCDVGKCWMESSPTEYSKCVFEKWDSQNNKCE